MYPPPAGCCGWLVWLGRLPLGPWEGYCGYDGGPAWRDVRRAAITSMIPNKTSTKPIIANRNALDPDVSGGSTGTPPVLAGSLSDQLEVCVVHGRLQIVFPGGRQK